MSKSLFAIASGIFITGLFAGLLAGIGFKTGQDVDPESLSIFVFQTVCNAIPKVPNTSFLISCDFTVVYLTILAFIVGIIEIFGTANKIGNWRIGLGIYGVGFIAGVVMVYQ